MGHRFRIQTPSGGTATLHAIGEYRDPQMLQGIIVTSRCSRACRRRTTRLVLRHRLPGRPTRAKQSLDNAAASRFPAAEVKTRPSSADAQIEEQLDQFVYLLYALLGMSVVISLFGIANCLFLSIHERTREFGLLRAVGATQAQVRRIVRYESVITAVIGALMGIGRRTAVRRAGDAVA